MHAFGQTTSWGDLLANARTRLFVGRETELARVAAFLDESGRLLYVSGPAGVGKTALLHELERNARSRDRRVRWVNAADISLTPAGISAAFGEDADVLVVDEFDRLAPLHGWMRETLLLRLPANMQVAVAGRSTPDAAWFDDRGWRDLVRWIALRNLRRSAAVAYLESRGATRERAEQLAPMTHGHPLCLNVLGDLLGHDTEVDATATIEATVRRILVDNTPPEQLRVLEAAAIPSIVTEPVLSAMLDRDACAQLKWLASLPFVEITDHGLRLHDIAARAIVDELRWRDPDRLRGLRRAAARYQTDRVRTFAASPAVVQNSMAEVLHILRDEPAAHLLASLPATSEFYADAPTSADEVKFVDAVARFEGAEASRVAWAWLESKRAELHVVRNRRADPVGFAMYVDLPCESACAIDDPVVQCVVDMLATQHPLRGGERASLCRWFFSVEAYQVPDDVQTQLFIHMAARLSFAPGIALGASVHRDPNGWLARPDRTHELLTRVMAWGSDYGVFGSDWRREPAWVWFERVVEKLSGMGMGKPPSPEVVLLERGAFAREVKRLLRNFHEPDVVTGSPLLWAALLRRRIGAAPPELLIAELKQVVVDACDRLAREQGQHEATDLLRLAFFTQPRRKQLALADTLGMGFSTYRRKLATAIRLLVGALWADELAST